MEDAGDGDVVDVVVDGFGAVRLGGGADRAARGQAQAAGPAGGAGPRRGRRHPAADAEAERAAHGHPLGAPADQHGPAERRLRRGRPLPPPAALPRTRTQPGGPSSLAVGPSRFHFGDSEALFRKRASAYS